MRLLEFLTRAITRSGTGGSADPEVWWRDPLSHPDLRKMSGTQLADLPFDPYRIQGDVPPPAPDGKPMRQGTPASIAKSP